MARSVSSRSDRIAVRCRGTPPSEDGGPRPPDGRDGGEHSGLGEQLAGRSGRGWDSHEPGRAVDQPAARARSTAAAARSPARSAASAAARRRASASCRSTAIPRRPAAWCSALAAALFVDGQLGAARSAPATPPGVRGRSTTRPAGSPTGTRRAGSLVGCGPAQCRCEARRRPGRTPTASWRRRPVRGCGRCPCTSAGGATEPRATPRSSHRSRTTGIERVRSTRRTGVRAALDGPDPRIVDVAYDGCRLLPAPVTAGPAAKHRHPCRRDVRRSWASSEPAVVVQSPSVDHRQ